jgi:hypothetical protein
MRCESKRRESTRCAQGLSSIQVTLRLFTQQWLFQLRQSGRMMRRMLALVAVPG